MQLLARGAEVGADTEAVLREAGLSAKEIADLAAGGAVNTGGGSG